MKSLKNLYIGLIAKKQFFQIKIQIILTSF